MPGWNSTQLNYSVLSGNQCVIFIGDTSVAFAQVSDQNVDFGAEGLYGIGTAKPQEIQQLKFTPSLTITSFVLTQQGITVLSYPSSIESVLANNAFNISVIDNNGNTIVGFIGCVCNGFSQNVPANAIVTENITFLALDVINSTGQSILNGNFALGTVAATTTGISTNTLGL